jgi:hypothetical protein
MIRIELADTNGDGVPDSGVVAEEYSLGVGGPIDVFAPSTNDPFFGTLFVSGLVDNGSIRILEPGDGSANIDPTDRDNDSVSDATPSRMTRTTARIPSLRLAKRCSGISNPRLPKAICRAELLGTALALQGLCQTGPTFPRH